MRVWRRLQKAGALHLKGSVYLLPESEEHRETLSWLIQEIETLGGEADFVVVERTATMAFPALSEAFRRSYAAGYSALDAEVESLERTLAAPRSVPGPDEVKRLAGQWRHMRDKHQDLTRADFYKLAQGVQLGQRLAALEKKLAVIKAQKAVPSGKRQRPMVLLRRREEYQGRLWVTRPQPFVDRMASAWLIRRFVDPSARFGFAAEEMPLPAGAVGFDMVGGEFSHLGGWCTFEVLVKAFGIKDKHLTHLARVVHELDLHDGKYNVPQARGMEEILRGVLRTAQDDQDALAKGMAVFDLFYASLT